MEEALCSILSFTHYLTDIISELHGRQGPSFLPLYNLHSADFIEVRTESSVNHL
jgi:hypothetical protein